MRELRVQRADLSNQLIVAEYEQCRAALLKNIELMDKSEVFYLSGSVIVAAYSAASNSHINYMTRQYSQEFMVLMLPIFILILGIIRFFVLDKTVYIYNQYLEAIESKNKYLNLTAFFRRHNNNRLYFGRLLPFVTGFFGYSVYLATLNIPNFYSIFTTLSVISFIAILYMLVIMIFGKSSKKM